METLVKDFEEYLKIEKGVSKNTSMSYVRDTNAFVRFVVDMKNKQVKDVTPEIMQDYVESLESQERAPSSISRAVASVRSFYAFLVNKQFAKTNPTLGISPIKVPKKEPEVLTPEEVDVLLSAPRPEARRGLRDAAMLELLYATGIRASELISLDVEDFNNEIGFITCNRNGRIRDIPLYAQAREKIQEYINKSRPKIMRTSKEQALFLNLNGGRLTRQGFWKIVKYYKEMVGIEKEINPQTFRHSFAIHLLENGADMRSIQEMMGYTDGASVQAYANVLRKRITKVYETAHPRAKKEEE